MLRHAAELETGKLRGQRGDENDLGEPELYHLGEEVGLSASALRDGLARLRAGELTGAEDDGLAQAGASDSQIVVRRTVPGPPGPIARAVERFLREQLMVVRRHHGSRIEWQRASGLWPGLVRSIAFARRFAFGPVSRVETRVEPAGPGAGMVGSTEVTFAIDLGSWRRERLLRACARAVAAFGCFGLGGAWLLPGFGLPDVVALLAGGGIAGGLIALEQRRFQHSRDEVAVAPARFLDLLVLRRSKALAAQARAGLGSELEPLLDPSLDPDRGANED